MYQNIAVKKGSNFFFMGGVEYFIYNKHREINKRSPILMYYLK